MTDLYKPDHVDTLQLYFCEPKQFNEYLIITQPTVGDIMEFGEKDFYSTLNIFIANTTMYRLQLWEAGKDWNKTTNYELFISLLPYIDPKAASLLFGDFDFSSFVICEKQKDDEISLTLYSKKYKMELDEALYVNIAHYIRTMFNIFPKNEWARGKATKEAIIWEDRQNYELRKKEPYDSSLLPLISSCVNHPGFKYKKTELKEIGIFEFMDSVNRLQVYESTTALLKGIYSGFVNSKDIDKEEFNFMKDLYKNKSS